MPSFGGDIGVYVKERASAPSAKSAVAKGSAVSKRGRAISADSSDERFSASPQDVR
jgi:hypothetical protein